MTAVDAVVVGGGGMGAAAAYELSLRGVETIVLEQFEIGHVRGSSRGPTRVFRHAYPELDYVHLARVAYGAWRELEDAAGEPLLRLTGQLDVGPYIDATVESLTAAGVPYEVLTQSAAAERFPAIDFDGIDRVLYHADAGVCRSAATIAALIRLARTNGVEVRERTRVTSLEPGGARVRVRTARGELRARTVVVTTGAWSKPLLARLGIPVRVTASSTHVAYFGPSDAVLGDVPIVIERGSDDPRPYTYVVPGEEPGNADVKVGRYFGDEPPVDADERTLEVDADVISLHSAYVARRLPALSPTPVRAESCLYEMTPSEDFLIDRRGRVVVGTGFSGHGFKFVPAVGRLLAQLATGERNVALPERFSLEHNLDPQIAS